MTAKKILVVIPTFNRKDLIELTSRYLERIDFDSGRFSFLVSDDCSTEFGLTFLKSAYGDLPNIRFMKTNRNSGAVAHVWVLFKFFLDSEFDKILVLDSDLIVHKSCVQATIDFDGELISSLYNSYFHRIDKECGTYCTKADIGWAGALVDRSIVGEMFNLFGARPFDDWALSDVARQRNWTIKVSRPSAIEHIGILGSNNVAPEHFDHSFDFPTEYIDEPTRDYFAKRHGIDLLRHLKMRPDTLAGDLSRFALRPGPGTKR